MYSILFDSFLACDGGGRSNVNCDNHLTFSVTSVMMLMCLYATYCYFCEPLIVGSVLEIFAMSPNLHYNLISDVGRLARLVRSC